MRWSNPDCTSTPLTLLTPLRIDSDCFDEHIQTFSYTSSNLMSFFIVRTRSSTGELGSWIRIVYLFSCLSKLTGVWMSDADVLNVSNAQLLKITKMSHGNWKLRQNHVCRRGFSTLQILMIFSKKERITFNLDKV